MTVEFMLRLAPEVADWFPVAADETFDAFVGRVRQEKSPARRAMLAACIGKIGKQFRAERLTRKRAWTAAARLSFTPGDRQSCKVCERYGSLTHAHHAVPLGLQFDAGATTPIQECVWLCPTHHTAIHLIIAGLVRRKNYSLEGDLEPTEWDVLQSIGVRFVELWTSLPNWSAVRR